MSDLTLVIGNKAYSSWSLRPWLLLKHLGVAFQEITVPLHAPDAATQIARYSPSGRVPVLLDGDHVIWESLAIAEFLAERYPEVWPTEAHRRALARSAASEMHAGFTALREELPFNCRARRSGVIPSPAAQADIERVATLWRTCRLTVSDDEGPWLFGPIHGRRCDVRAGCSALSHVWHRFARRHPGLRRHGSPGFACASLDSGCEHGNRCDTG